MPLQTLTSPLAPSFRPFPAMAGFAQNAIIGRDGPESFGRRKPVVGLGPPMAVQPQFANRKLSVSEMMAANQRGGPNMSLVTDAASGRRLTNQEATDRGPFAVDIQGGGRGRGYGGGYGGYGSGYGSRGRTPISSAGVAGGTPTSRRGRFELAMEQNPELNPEDAWAQAKTPAWDQASPDPFAPNPRYGNMGRPVPRGGDLDLNVTGYAEGTRNSGAKPRVAVVGEEGPEAMIIPPQSQVIPLTDSAFGKSAIDDIMGAEESGPPDGEIRQDSEGNYWKYDAAQKRGIPMNPYIGNPNAPSPNAFRASPSERYQDLSMRLSALRNEGMAQGRADVARLQAQQAEEQAKTAEFLASGEAVTPDAGGGTLYRTKYGNAIVGGTRPRSFTVENFEGGQTTSGDLAAADRESRADAAERTVRGLGTRGYRALPMDTPTTAEDALPPAAIDGVVRGLGEPPMVEERPLGQRPQSVAGVDRGAFDDIEETPAPEDVPVIKPPTNNMSRPELRTKAEEAVAGFLGELGIKNARGVSLEEVGKFMKNMWDEWFTRGGTEANREARKAHDALTPEQAKKFNEELRAALQKKGYRLIDQVEQRP